VRSCFGKFRPHRCMSKSSCGWCSGGVCGKNSRGRLETGWKLVVHVASSVASVGVINGESSAFSDESEARDDPSHG